MPSDDKTPGPCRFSFFWLMVFFRLTAVAPAMVRFARPLFIRLAYLFSLRIRSNTAANGLRLGVADPRAFGLAVTGSFYDFVYDIGRSIGNTRMQLAVRVDAVQGAEHYLSARESRRGAVLLTAHMGSFEAGLAALPVHEQKVHVVFKRDQMVSFDRLRRLLREQLNVIEAPIDDGLAMWMRLREALLNDEVVAVQGDRVMPGQKGLRVPLSGGTVMLPTGPFKLALSANAPVIPIFSIRQPDGKVRIVIYEPINVGGTVEGIEIAVKSFAATLSDQLVKYPEQWLVLDRAFCEDA